MYGLIIAGIIFVQGLVIYVIARYVIVSHFRINPFRNGWGYLQQFYGAVTGPITMEVVSAIIGPASFNKNMLIKFESNGLFLRKKFFATDFLYLPYNAIVLVAPPKQVTILFSPLATAGIFKVSGVDFFLEVEYAKTLIEKITTSTQISTSSV